MEEVQKSTGRYWGIGIVVGILAVIAFVYIRILFMNAEEQEELLYLVQDFLPIIMFGTLASLLFSGFPVAFILGGIAFLFGMIGYWIDMFDLIEFFNFLPRIWFQGAENLVLVAVPAFVFMGVMMERSGVANDLLYCVQVLLKNVAGSLALAVIVMGTVLAAMTGIIGASVTMMTALALPTMIKQGYKNSLSCGCIAASGTLGILIPPSIMLIIMADLMAVSVGNMFMAAIIPGLVLAFFYLLFVALYAKLRPEVAPSLPPELLYVPRNKYPAMIFKSFLPPVLLIFMIKGSILFGIAAPSEAGAVGAFGTILLAIGNRRLTFDLLKGVCHTSARTIAMIFFIIISATCFAYVYRSLGGDDIVEHLILSAGLTSWQLLILLMAITFMLGFFLDWIEITLIVLPVFAPLITGLDFGEHVASKDIVFWFLVLMAINLQTSFLTPPFGFALFYLKGIAPREVKIQEIYKGIIPFVLLQLGGLILVMWKPDVALWLMKLAYDY
tara:strand:+ start:16314 stop:17810 length:1497 start_codon:yes stop_codon:yes gene_type:complete